MKSPFSNVDSVGAALQQAAEQLQSTSTSPRLDSEILLGYVLGLSRVGLLTRLREPCSETERIRFFSLVSRRIHGEPVAYLVGEREFLGLAFQVTPAVLVPRPETELMVEHARDFLLARGAAARILDLGTGSGCIALSLAHELRVKGFCNLAVDAVDKSREALKVAQSNSERLGLHEVVRFIESDWCANKNELSPTYDCIIANPPYVDPTENTPIELSYEPRQALFSPNKGLFDTSVILEQATPLLKPTGVMLIEVGAGKREYLETLLAPYRDHFEISYLGDHSESDRFCVVRMLRRSGS